MSRNSFVRPISRYKMRKNVHCSDTTYFNLSTGIYSEQISFVD